VSSLIPNRLGWSHGKISTRGSAIASVVRTPEPLPTTAQIRAWLLTHDWELASRGEAGTLWYLTGSPVPGVGVPDDDGDPVLTMGVLERIASRSNLALDSLMREMRRLLHA
jgi:hypothetical protein